MSATNANHGPTSTNRAFLIPALVSALLLTGLAAAVGFAVGRADSASIGFGPGSPQTASSDGLLLPDLRTMPPEDLSMEVNGGGTRAPPLALQHRLERRAGPA